MFSTSHFCSICCSQNFSLTSCPETMTKRMQEEKGKERIVAESKPTLNLSHAAVWGYSGHSVNLVGRVQGDLWREKHNQEAALSSSVAKRCRNGRENEETRCGREGPIHQHFKSTRKLVASGNLDIDGTGTVWPHNLHISAACVPHLEKVFSHVRQRCGLKPGDTMENLDVNAAICGIFMSVTLRAAGHLGKDYSEKLRSIKNQPKRSLKQLFHATEKLITDQKDDYGYPSVQLAAACVAKDNLAY